MTPRRVRQPRNVTATRLLRYQLHLRRDTTITSTARRTHRIMISYQVSVECRCLGVDLMGTQVGTSYSVSLMIIYQVSVECRCRCLGVECRCLGVTHVS